MRIFRRAWAWFLATLRSQSNVVRVITGFFVGVVLLVILLPVALLYELVTKVAQDRLGPAARWAVAALVFAVVVALLNAPDQRGQVASASPSAGPTLEATPRPTPRPTPTAEATPALGTEPVGPTEAALVVEVVDGDTIKVHLGGQVFTVRYIGIDSPETVDPGSPVGWMGPEANAANLALVGGKTVYLERDVSETDSFGRLLRYAWLRPAAGWLLVNTELVRRGFAVASTYPPDVRYQDVFRLAESRARATDVGLWGPTPTPLPTATPAPAPPAPAPPAPPPPAANCDASYPTVCIPPYPPDLDCGDIPYRRFQVLAPDPHGFDGDNDGIGCES